MVNTVPGNGSAAGAETSNATTPSKPSGENDIFGLLSADDKDEGSEEIKEETGEEEESDDSGSGEDEGEDSEEEDSPKRDELDDDEEAEEEIEPTEEEKILGLTFKKLQSKIPDIFKKAPELRTIIGQHKAYRDLLPTVNDAKELVAMAETFSYFDHKMSQEGDMTPVYEVLHRRDVATGGTKLNELAEKLLPTLHKISPEAFNTAARPLVSSILTRAIAQARQAGNKNLGLAAEILSEFVFGSKTVPQFDKKRDDPALENKRRELEARERNLVATQHNKVLSELASEVDRRLGKEILKRIDPENVLSEHDRNAQINQILNVDLEDELSSNPDHMKLMASLTRRLASSGYSEEEKARWKGTFLARARTALTPILRRAMASGKKLNSINSTTAKRGDGRKVIPSSSKTAPTFKNGKLPSAVELRKSGMSILDILNATDK